MIKATDLRIGNLIFIEVGLPGLQLHTIQGKDIADIQNGRITLSAMQPVLITPELLKRLDFETHDGLYKRVHTSFYLRYREGSGVDMAIEDLYGNKHYLRYNIKHLHELQNIYYWLMKGEELTIKETC